MISSTKRNLTKRRERRQRAVYTTLMAIRLKRRRKKRRVTKMMTLKMATLTSEKTMLKKTQQLQRQSFKVWQSTQNLMCNFNSKTHTKLDKSRQQPMLTWSDFA